MRWELHRIDAAVSEFVEYKSSTGIPPHHDHILEFALLAATSIFFLVDPFAAIPSFIAITAGADAARRRRMAAKASLTCLIVLTSFALAGQLIWLKYKCRDALTGGVAYGRNLFSGLRG